MTSNVANIGGEMVADLFTGSGAGLITNTVPRNKLVTDTAYAVVVNDGSGYLTEVSTLGTAGQAFSSNGASALPSFQTVSSVGAVSVQRFTTNGTYTPTAGMKYCIVEICGGGGGGGGAGGNVVNAQAVGAGGAGGAYARSFYPAATIGASKAVVIGGGGAGGISTGPGDSDNNGSTGGNTTFGGALMTAAGGPGGAATGGTIYSTSGSNGRPGISTFNTIGTSFCLQGGDGGSNTLGMGGAGASGDENGHSGVGYGCGGGGGAAASGGVSSPGHTGGAGLAGYCIVLEYS
jgi:hypothetical protein